MAGYPTYVMAYAALILLVAAAAYLVVHFAFLQRRDPLVREINDIGAESIMDTLFNARRQSRIDSTLAFLACIGLGLAVVITLIFAGKWRPGPADVTVYGR